MSKYPQNTMHAKIMYGWTNRGQTDTGHTFAPVDLTAPKVAAGNENSTQFVTDGWTHGAVHGLQCHLFH